VLRATSLGYRIGAYRNFIKQLDPESDHNGKLERRKCPLPPDLMRLATEITRCVKRLKGKSRKLILFELLDGEGDVATFDDLCAAIHTAISSGRLAPLWCIGVAVTMYHHIYETP